MRRSSAFLLSIFVLISMLFMLCHAGCQKENQAEDHPLPEAAKPTQASIFVAEQEFYALIADRQAVNQNNNNHVTGRIVSGVLPHHLVAGRLIADFMEVVAGQEPELVVLIGPNHNLRGGKLISGLYAWQTPAGLVEVAEDIVRDLFAREIVVRDEETIGQEHSVGTLMPFIRHYLPQAKVVPVIVQGNVSLTEIEKLLEALEPYLDEYGEKAVLLASVDFSHYLTRTEAQLKDQETLAVMRRFDYLTLFRMGDDHLDSPASLAAAFRWAEKNGIKEFRLLANTNSGIIMKNDVMETTSYFTLFFTLENKPTSLSCGAVSGTAYRLRPGSAAGQG